MKLYHKSKNKIEKKKLYDHNVNLKYIIAKLKKNKGKKEGIECGRGKAHFPLATTSRNT